MTRDERIFLLMIPQHKKGGKFLWANETFCAAAARVRFKAIFWNGRGYPAGLPFLFFLPPTGDEFSAARHQRSTPVHVKLAQSGQTVESHRLS